MAQMYGNGGDEIETVRRVELAHIGKSLKSSLRRQGSSNRSSRENTVDWGVEGIRKVIMKYERKLLF
ncbi:uncharacterized protein G2W53_030235 [Senna tora]|uniref:Uncharacterized protein n=1 Tax=Senna tora TaxID=362788 RepID=A0A834T747_9FABA|nr:uncharacterized protein G2W53_030235 [Senna tora]